MTIKTAKLTLAMAALFLGGIAAAGTSPANLDAEWAKVEASYAQKYPGMACATVNVGGTPQTEEFLTEFHSRSLTENAEDAFGEVDVLHTLQKDEHNYDEIATLHNGPKDSTPPEGIWRGVGTTSTPQSLTLSACMLVPDSPEAAKQKALVVALDFVRLLIMAVEGVRHQGVSVTVSRPGSTSTCDPSQDREVFETCMADLYPEFGEPIYTEEMEELIGASSLMSSMEGMEGMGGVSSFMNFMKMKQVESSEVDSVEVEK